MHNSIMYELPSVGVKLYQVGGCRKKKRANEIKGEKAMKADMCEKKNHSSCLPQLRQDWCA